MEKIKLEWNEKNQTKTERYVNETAWAKFSTLPMLDRHDLAPRLDGGFQVSPKAGIFQK
jgi:hypothetical protein